jgi:hypothetical protein
MVDDQHTHLAGFGGSDECLLSPVCVLIQALSSTRPEVTQHLLAAGRELALALKAGVESQAEAYDRAAERAGQALRRIKVD